MMTENQALLSAVHKNAEMGCDAIAQLMSVAKDDFRQLLCDQQNQYDSIMRRARESLCRSGAECKTLSKATKLKTAVMIRASTLQDTSEPNLSSMLLQGSTMGLIEIARALRRHSAASNDVKALGGELLGLEQSSADMWRARVVQ